MTALLKRLFSATYRKALAAEARGDFVAAAQSYALSNEPAKVADMHLAQARAEPRVEDRIRSLRAALHFTPEGDERRMMVLRLLVGALLECADRRTANSEEQAQLLEEAIKLGEEEESWEMVGDCYLKLGQPLRAAEAFSSAGLVERVESVLGEEERERDRERQEASLFKDYELLLQGGRRDDAAEALRGCAEVARLKGDYRRLLSELEDRILTAGRCTLAANQQRVLFIGHFPLTLGRDSDCDLQTGGPSVSRHHAQILFSPKSGFSLADGGSRNGTLLNGLVIESELPLPSAGTIGLGEGCLISFSQTAPLPVLLLEIKRGINQGRRAAASGEPFEMSAIFKQAPPLRLAFQHGKPHLELPGQSLSLNDALVATPLQLITGDVIRHQGWELQVLGR